MSREVWQDPDHPYYDVMKTVVKNIRSLSPTEALELLESRVQQIGSRINKAAQTRILTGGFWSQALDNFVWREVGKRAGLFHKFKGG